MAKLTRNTHIKIVLIVLLCLMLCGGLVLCGRFIPLSGASAAFRSYDHSGSFEVDATTVSRIDFSWLAGNATIRVVPDNQTAGMIQVSETRKGFAPELGWSFTDGLLEIGYSRTPFGGVGGCVRAAFDAKDVTVLLPVSLSDRLERLSVDVASGTYSLDQVGCRELGLSMASGELSASGFSCTDAGLDISSGKVTLDGAIGGELEIDQASGDVSVSCAGDQPRIAILDVTSGVVALELNRARGFELIMDKTTGSFNCNMPLESTSDNARRAGDGYTKLNVNLVSGTLNVMGVD
ncbi:DUF4097 family beta strand repeat-containing protein [Adlercreutzia sp. ZJ138]|uniref:DUF4097 family beta strand repeat-containing protein n=1 Tax=Adlercreutzia sp. ZJ138 TaxID=2709405 RepID=UPI0013EA19B7|nr:DUF4097 family beta strand repeat-containing protein [Adlercreutzia sp. ZJ138]